MAVFKIKRIKVVQSMCIPDALSVVGGSAKAHSPYFLEVIDQARNRIRGHGSRTFEIEKEIAKELGLRCYRHDTIDRWGLLYERGA